MTRASVISAFILLIAATVASSCSHKDILCPGKEERRIHVLFEWDNAPDASPAGMTVYFYPRSQGGQIWRFDIVGRSGGEVAIPVGRYTMIAFNNDLAGIRFSGLESASTPEASPKLNSSGVSGSTGQLYSGAIMDLEVTICGVTYRRPDGTVKECGQGLLRCSPTPLSSRYNVTVRNISGLQHVRSASAIITAPASGVNLSTAIFSSAKCSLGAQMNISSADSTLRCSATALQPALNLQDAVLTLQITRTDGKKLSKAFNVTDQILSSPDIRNINILIDSLNIPDGDVPSPPSGDGDDVGIEVGVDGWSDIIIDIFT